MGCAGKGAAHARPHEAAAAATVTRAAAHTPAAFPSNTRSVQSDSEVPEGTRDHTSRQSNGQQGRLDTSEFEKYPTSQPTLLSSKHLQPNQFLPASRIVNARMLRA